jgi:hypothetical protein
MTILSYCASFRIIQDLQRQQRTRCPEPQAARSGGVVVRLASGTSISQRARGRQAQVDPAAKLGMHHVIAKMRSN